MTAMPDEGTAQGGPRDSLDDVIPRVYDELKVLARARRYRWGDHRAPGTTSLVHDAYAKLARQQSGDYGDRRRFFGLASRVMRSLLVDNARWHLRLKRGQGAVAVSADALELVSAERADELLEIDTALRGLERDEPGLAQIVECRVFGGLTIEETAEALEISPATVKRRWALAKAWLYRELQASD